jgi:hypothetical protein
VLLNELFEIYEPGLWARFYFLDNPVLVNNVLKRQPPRKINLIGGSYFIPVVQLRAFLQ